MPVIYIHMAFCIRICLAKGEENVTGDGGEYILSHFVYNFRLAIIVRGSSRMNKSSQIWRWFARSVRIWPCPYDVDGLFSIWVPLCY